MNKTIKSFYDAFECPDIQKVIDFGKKNSLEVIYFFNFKI